MCKQSKERVPLLLMIFRSWVRDHKRKDSSATQTHHTKDFNNLLDKGTYISHSLSLFLSLSLIHSLTHTHTDTHTQGKLTVSREGEDKLALLRVKREVTNLGTDVVGDHEVAGVAHHFSKIHAELD